MRVKRKKKTRWRRRWFLTWVRGEEEAKFEEIAARGCPPWWRGCPASWSSQRLPNIMDMLPTIMEMLPSILIFSKVAHHHGYVAHHHDLAVSLLLRGCPASSSSTSFTSSHQPEAIRNKNSTSNKGNLQSWFLWRTKTTFVASAVFTQKSRFLVSGGEQVATTVALRGFIIPLGRILGVGDFGRRMGQPSSGSTIQRCGMSQGLHCLRFALVLMQPLCTSCHCQGVPAPCRPPLLSQEWVFFNPGHLLSSIIGPSWSMPSILTINHHNDLPTICHQHVEGLQDDICVLLAPDLPTCGWHSQRVGVFLFRAFQHLWFHV